jgi:hypothetical protein
VLFNGSHQVAQNSQSDVDVGSWSGRVCLAISVPKPAKAALRFYVGGVGSPGPNICGKDVDDRLLILSLPVFCILSGYLLECIDTPDSYVLICIRQLFYGFSVPVGNLSSPSKSVRSSGIDEASRSACNGQYGGDPCSCIADCLVSLSSSANTRMQGQPGWQPPQDQGGYGHQDHNERCQELRVAELANAVRHGLPH